MSKPTDPANNDFPSTDEPDADEFSTREFTEIERGDTAIRLGLTLLFVLVNGVLNSILGVTVIFELLWALVAKLPPSPQIRSFANRLIAYQYRIKRYMTYNESVVPFPFGEFPDELEPSAFDPERSDSVDLGLPDDWMERDRVPRES